MAKEREEEKELASHCKNKQTKKMTRTALWFFSLSRILCILFVNMVERREHEDSLYILFLCFLYFQQNIFFSLQLVSRNNPSKNFNQSLAKIRRMYSLFPLCFVIHNCNMHICTYYISQRTFLITHHHLKNKWKNMCM